MWWDTGPRWVSESGATGPAGWVVQVALGVRGTRQRPSLDGAALCTSGLVISRVRHLCVWLSLTAALREKEGCGPGCCGHLFQLRSSRGPWLQPLALPLLAHLESQAWPDAGECARSQPRGQRFRHRRQGSARWLPTWTDQRSLTWSTLDEDTQHPLAARTPPVSLEAGKGGPLMRI